jgi:hypothetical protein
MRLGGEELLDQGIGADDPDSEDFVEGGASGWDELVPNVDASNYPGSGPWAGTQLPDHGEAWRLPWSVLEESADILFTKLLGTIQTQSGKFDGDICIDTGLLDTIKCRDEILRG